MDPLHRDPWFYVFVALLIMFLIGAERASDLDDGLNYLERSNVLYELRKAGLVQ